MNAGPLRGPLPLVVLVVALFIAYKYIPLDTISERFQRGNDVETVAAPPLSPPGADSPVAGRDAPGQPPPPPPQAAPTGESAARATAADVAMTEASTPEDPAAALPEQPPLPAPAVEVGSPAIVDAARPTGTAPSVDVMPQRPQTAKITRVSPPATVAKPAVEPAAQVTPAAAPVQPGLHVFVAADVDYRAGLDAYTAERYAALLQQELFAAAAAYLGPDGLADDVGNRAFREDLAAGGDSIEQLCAQVDGGRILLADLTIPTAGFSTMESAYWPEVELKAINCSGNRLHRKPRQRLEPHHLDRFPYQHRFREMAEQFVASQAYFLKP